MPETAGSRSRSYVVECYWPGVSEEKLTAAARRADEAASALRELGADVDFVGSILVPADETVFCLFDGIEEDVREASERAGVPFERVLESLRVDGGRQRQEDRVR
jgi:hypothetical protein